MATGVIDNRAQFCKWLQENAPKLRADLLCQYLTIGEEFCLKIKVLYEPLFETTDISTIKKFVRTITNNKIFRIRNKKQHPAIVDAANRYYSFVMALQMQQLNDDNSSVSVKRVENDDGSAATQPKWNRYESALLLEGCLKIQHGEDRKTIVRELSKTLRKMGEKSGYLIDEIFRNENGIAWQMKRMEIALSGKVCDVKPNKVFIEVANLYRENIEVFCELLNEAHKAVDDKEIVAEASLRIVEENS